MRKKDAALFLRAWRVLAATWLVCAALGASAEDQCAVLLEAESFGQRGGWVIDQQAMDQMGSPYLLAHGLGRPVEDAITSVRLPDAGVWHVWVRTWDWVSPWGVPGAPGRFRVLLDGKPLTATFGTCGAAWDWQGGQAVRVTGSAVEVALDDLTGFAGRCDAIAFTTSQSAPPNRPEELEAFRRERLGLPAVAPTVGEYDLVVAGGGVAGACAAVTAARLGLDVALIQDRPVLGGNSSSEIGVPASGDTNVAPFPHIGHIVRELGAEGDDRRRRVVEAEKNIRLFLNMRVIAVEAGNGRIAAVVAQHIVDGRRLRFAGRLFADCTGDGNLGFLAGADWRMGREGRDETNEPMAPPKPDQVKMGATLHWQSSDTGQPRPFPDCQWAIPIDEDSCIDLMRTTSSRYYWETGFRYDAATQTELIRDYMLRAIYGNWAFLKNRSPLREGYANLELSSVAYVLGKRESRRLLGDVILTEHDIRNKTPYDDACLTSTWGIDLHTPHPVNESHFPGNAFICRGSGLPKKNVEIYSIPYRCLYSRNIENLFMAGRNISVTHVALGQVRVQNTTGMMGEVVGRAASICVRHHVSPRTVYKQHLAELKELLHNPVQQGD